MSKRACPLYLQFQDRHKGITPLPTLRDLVTSCFSRVVRHGTIKHADCVGVQAGAAVRSSHIVLIIMGPFMVFLSGAASLTHGLEVAPTGDRDPKQPAVEQPVNPAIAINRDQSISACVTNLPLSEVLRVMSEGGLFDMKGPLPSDETVSITFSDLTLAKVLKKLMRGYNYVLLDQEAGKKPLLMVIGKVVRASPAEQKTPRSLDAPPSGTQAHDPGASQVPPAIADQRQPAATASQSVPFRRRSVGPSARPPPSADQAAGQLQTSSKQPAGETGQSALPSRSEYPVPEETRRVGSQPQPQSGQIGPVPVPENTGVRF
jgi:hypothetical protein